MSMCASPRIPYSAMMVYDTSETSMPVWLLQRQSSLSIRCAD